MVYLTTLPVAQGSKRQTMGRVVKSELERRPLSNFRYYSDNFLEELRSRTKDVSQDTWSRGRRINSELQENDAA
jgi:hypothetical protein